MKRAREETDQADQDHGENDATKNGVGGGSDDREDREELRMFSTNKMANLRGLTMTDTNSNQLIEKDEGDNLGLEEKQTTKDPDQVGDDLNGLKLFDLPVEILPSIVKFLDPASIKDSRLVSHLMKEVVEVPGLWTWATLEVNHLNHEEVLDSDVVPLVSGIRFHTDIGVFHVSNLTGHLFRALLAGQFSQLVEVYFSSNDLRYVEPDLFRAVASVQVCQLPDCRLTKKQLSAIFSALQNTADLKLRTLDISGVDLSSLDPELLQSVVRLDCCCLEDTHLTPQQVFVIFKSLQETPAQDLKLKVLQISNVDLSSLNPGMIHSVVKLESLKMRSVLHSFLHTDIDLFEAILETTELKLRTVDLGGNCFVGVPRKTLVGAVARLETVILSAVHLSTDHLRGIFKLAAGKKPSSLLEIDLRHVDVYEVPLSLRAEAQKNKKVKIKYDDQNDDEEGNVEGDMDWSDEHEDDEAAEESDID